MRIAVIDYKHGAGVPVDPFWNEQLMLYGLGAARKHGLSGEDTVDMIIVQPRADASVTGKPDWRCFSLTVAELENWVNEKLLPAVRATEAEDAPLCAGAHCKFCPAKPHCPEMRKMAMDAAQIELDKDFMPARSVEKTPPPAHTLTNEQLGYINRVLGVVEPWFASVREELSLRLEQGTAMPEETGFKRVKGQGRRSWENETEANVFLFKHLRSDAYNAPTTRSPAQAEQVFKEKGLDTKLLAPFIKKTHGVALVPLSDKRPALEPLLADLPAAAAEDDEF